MRRRLSVAGLAAVAAVTTVGSAAYAYSYTGGVTTRVSVAYTADPNPNETSQRPRISADGCHVVYQSVANNLVPNDPGAHSVDVFESHRTNCANPSSPVQVVRVSRKAGSTGAGGITPNGNSTFTGVSGDGRYVTFQSDATDLVAGKTTSVGNVFLRDMSTGVTRLVSHSASGGSANGYSTRPNISRDGRYVVYNSKATNLVPGATHPGDLYVWDRVSDSTRRLTVSSTGGNANGESLHAEISLDGRYVAYQSDASNLVAGDTNAKTDVFRTGNPFQGLSVKSVLVSKDVNGGSANQSSTRPAINGNGQYVAWQSVASDIVPGDTNGVLDAFVRNMATGRVTRVSVGPNGEQLRGATQRPNLDGAGDTVVFASNDHNVVPNDGNTQRDVFLREFWETPSMAFNKRISVDVNGNDGGCATAAPAKSYAPMARAGGEDLSSRAFLSEDGKVVAFISGMCDLVPNDTNRNVSLDDIFVRDYR